MLQLLETSTTVAEKKKGEEFQDKFEDAFHQVDLKYNVDKNVLLEIERVCTSPNAT